MRRFSFHSFPLPVNSNSSSNNNIIFCKIIFVGAIPVILSSGKKKRAFDGKFVSRNNFRRAIIIRHANRNEISSYVWDLLFCFRGLLLSAKDHNYRNTLATVFPLLTVRSTSLVVLCVSYFNLWLVVFDPTHCCHYLRTKLFPQRSVLIPIDCCVVGSEPSMLNLLVLLKLKSRTAEGVRLSSVLF